MRLAGKPWCEPGLSACDLLMALDSPRVSTANLEALPVSYQVSDTLTLHPLRRYESTALSVLLTARHKPAPLVKKHQGDTPDPEFGVTRKCEEFVSLVVKLVSLRMLDDA